MFRTQAFGIARADRAWFDLCIISTVCFYDFWALAVCYCWFPGGLRRNLLVASYKTLPACKSLLAFYVGPPHYPQSLGSVMVSLPQGRFPRWHYLPLEVQFVFHWYLDSQGPAQCLINNGLLSKFNKHVELINQSVKWIKEVMHYPQGIFSVLAGFLKPNYPEDNSYKFSCFFKVIYSF